MKILGKFEEAFDKLTEKFSDFWCSGHYIRAVLALLLPSIGVGLIIALLIMGTNSGV